ncbi:unnamed protein product, partial [Meganyctiphanes norvegica]
AAQAGCIIRDVMNKGNLGIVEKENAYDLQTEADRAAQRCIISSLSKHFPKITIIGEEEDTGVGTIVDVSKDNFVDVTCPSQFTELKEDELVMTLDFVDPVLSISSFECQRSGHQGVCKNLSIQCSSLLEHVTVLIGIAVNGKAIGGVIHQPYYNCEASANDFGRTVWGVVGDKVGGMSVQHPPSSGCIVTTTRSHSSATVNDAVNALTPDQVMRVGGAGHKVMLLLEGQAHAYVFASPGCKKWDTCGPQAVLESAGGCLTDIQGKPIPYDSTAPHRNKIRSLATRLKDALTSITKTP